MKSSDYKEDFILSFLGKDLKPKTTLSIIENAISSNIQVKDITCILWNLFDRKIVTLTDDWKWQLNIDKVTCTRPNYTIKLVNSTESSGIEPILNSEYQWKNQKDLSTFLKSIASRTDNPPDEVGLYETSFENSDENENVEWSFTIKKKKSNK